MNPSRSILATLFVALLLVGCSEESMLTGPDVSAKMTQDEVVKSSVETTSLLHSAKKGNNPAKVPVCHVDQDDPEAPQVYIEVSANAAEKHLFNHVGDKIVSAGTDCNADPSEAWIDLIINRFGELISTDAGVCYGGQIYVKSDVSGIYVEGAGETIFIDDQEVPNSSLLPDQVASYLVENLGSVEDAGCAQYL